MKVLPHKAVLADGKKSWSGDDEASQASVSNAIMKEKEEEMQ